MINNIKNLNFTSTQLKIIAIIFMIIDHIGAIILPKFLYIDSELKSFFFVYAFITSLRIIGRLSFPIFSYLIVTGFLHTRNKYTYLFRLLLFAIVSEIFFDFSLFNKWFYINNQNILFLLSIGLISIWIFSFFMNRKKYIIFGFLFVFTLAIIAEKLYISYGFYGVINIFLMYFFYKNFKYMSISLIILNIVYYFNLFFTWNQIPYIFKSIYGLNLTGSYSNYIWIFMYLFNIIQVFSILSLVIIYFYNGKKGKEINKYIFYIFYPLHLIILKLISLIL